MNNDTLVFRYAVSATDVDADGITLGENVLQGWVDADLGHKGLPADTKNDVN